MLTNFDTKKILAELTELSLIAWPLMPTKIVLNNIGH